MTLGGPIIKNKLFFFVNFEYEKVPTVVNRWRPSEDGVANPDLYISRTTVADMQKVKDFLRDKYGYDTGSYTDFPANESNIKALARVDWNINDDHHLSVRYNYTLNRGWNNTNGSSSNCGFFQQLRPACYTEPSVAVFNGVRKLHVFHGQPCEFILR